MARNAWARWGGTIFANAEILVDFAIAIIVVSIADFGAAKTYGSIVVVAVAKDERAIIAFGCTDTAREVPATDAVPVEVDMEIAAARGTVLVDFAVAVVVPAIAEFGGGDAAIDRAGRGRFVHRAAGGADAIPAEAAIDRAVEDRLVAHGVAFAVATEGGAILGTGGRAVVGRFADVVTADLMLAVFGAGLGCLTALADLVSTRGGAVTRAGLGIFATAISEAISVTTSVTSRGLAAVLGARVRTLATGRADAVVLRGTVARTISAGPGEDDVAGAVAAAAGHIVGVAVAVVVESVGEVE